MNFFEGGSPVMIQAGLELTGSQDQGGGYCVWQLVLF